jgi:phosphoribosylformimino-5-aminoimidazole carboxamide ribonucleotide (ProFAR) isomerase
MDLYARVNILGGLSVRLPHGGLDDAIPLDNDPIGRARSWVEQGIKHLHIVDLDAAAYSDSRNRELMFELVESVDARVQVAGGIRSETEAESFITRGAWRIVMGTAAIENQNMIWDLCRDNPDKIAVALDVRADEEIATRGWTQNSGRYLEEVMIEMSSAGVVAFLVSEAGRNALEDMPNFQLIGSALATVEEPVIASGGVRHLEDLRRLVSLDSSGRRLGGVIVGREVTAGRFTVEEALEVLAGRGPSKAPGGIVAARQLLQVGSVDSVLQFLEEIVGLRRVRSPETGVLGTVLEVAEGQQVELVQGASGQTATLALLVEDPELWLEHFKAQEVETTRTSAGLEVAGPGGLTLRFE